MGLSFRRLVFGVDAGKHIGVSGLLTGFDPKPVLLGASSFDSDGGDEVEALSWILERATAMKPAGGASLVIAVESLVPEGETDPKLMTREGFGHDMAKNLIRAERIGRTFEVLARETWFAHVERCTATEARSAIVGTRTPSDTQIANKLRLRGYTARSKVGPRWHWNAHSRDALVAALFVDARMRAPKGLV